MPDTSETYASYLLRLQRVQADVGCAWIISTQSTATGELRQFANLEALLCFLREEFGGCERVKDVSPPALPGSPDNLRHK